MFLIVSSDTLMSLHRKIEISKKKKKKGKKSLLNMIKILHVLEFFLLNILNVKLKLLFFVFNQLSGKIVYVSIFIWFNFAVEFSSFSKILLFFFPVISSCNQIFFSWILYYFSSRERGLGYVLFIFVFVFIPLVN